MVYSFAEMFTNNIVLGVRDWGAEAVIYSLLKESHPNEYFNLNNVFKYLVYIVYPA